MLEETEASSLCVFSWIICNYGPVLKIMASVMADLRLNYPYHPGPSVVFLWAGQLY